MILIDGNSRDAPRVQVGFFSATSTGYRPGLRSPSSFRGHTMNQILHFFGLVCSGEITDMEINGELISHETVLERLR